MRVITKAILDMNTMEWTSIESYDYEGPVALCKGDDTAKQNEQMQMQFNSQLMDIFSQQFAKQSQVLNFLKGKLQPMINNPTGYSPAAMAALRTQATDNLSGQYQQAQRALQQKEFAQGGRELPSGVNAQLDAGLYAQEAADKANAQNTITLNNENLKQSNYWNAMNVLSGNVAQQFNPLGYAGAATSGSNAVANLSQAVTASNQSQLMGALGGIVGGAASSALGGGGAITKILGCWIAAACFDGFDDPRTIMVRTYLNTEFIKHWYGRAVMSLYLRFGERIAKNRTLVRLLKPLFEYALKQARKASA